MSRPYLDETVEFKPLAYSASDVSGNHRLAVLNHRRAAAIEIAPNSDVDCCIVETGNGRFYVGVGAPAVGPFEGPFVVHGVQSPPVLTGVSAGADPATAFIGGTPLLVLRIHGEAPSAFLRRRACGVREVTGVALPNATATNVLSIPWYGRSRGTVSLKIDGASGTYRLVGRQYFNLGREEEAADFEMLAATAIGLTVWTAKHIDAEEMDEIRLEITQSSGTAKTAMAVFRTFDD